jgi:hypothetical protein
MHLRVRMEAWRVGCLFRVLCLILYLDTTTTPALLLT